MPLTEADIEQIALDWFAECGYTCVHGPDIAPGEAAAERESYEQVVLVDRLRTSARRLNQALAERDIGTRRTTELIGVIKKMMYSMMMTTIFTTVVNSTASYL